MVETLITLPVTITQPIEHKIGLALLNAPVQPNCEQYLQDYTIPKEYYYLSPAAIIRLIELEAQIYPENVAIQLRLRTVQIATFADLRSDNLPSQ